MSFGQIVNHVGIKKNFNPQKDSVIEFFFQMVTNVFGQQSILLGWKIKNLVIRSMMGVKLSSIR